MNEFYERFRSLGKEDLFKIILAPDDYLEEAIKAARQVVADNDWTDELESREQWDTKREEAKEKRHTEILRNEAEYHKKIIEFQKEDKSFTTAILIRDSDSKAFLDKLAEWEIDYFSDENDETSFGGYSSHTYYFQKADADSVRQIITELGIVSEIKMEGRPFFRLELIVLISVVAISILVVLFFANFGTNSRIWEADRDFKKMLTKIEGDTSEVMDMRTASINGNLPFLSKKATMLELLGEPDSITKMVYDCPGYFDTDEVQAYYYGESVFQVYKDTAVLQYLYFDDRFTRLSTERISLTGETPLDMLRSVYPIAVKLNSAFQKGDVVQTYVRILPARGYDDRWLLLFEDRKLVAVEYWIPC